MSTAQLIAPIQSLGTISLQNLIDIKKQVETIMLNKIDDKIRWIARKHLSARINEMMLNAKDKTTALLIVRSVNSCWASKEMEEELNKNIRMSVRGEITDKRYGFYGLRELLNEHGYYWNNDDEIIENLQDISFFQDMNERP